jgi:hypothetical protein
VTIVATTGAIVKDGEFPTPFGTLIIVLVLLLLPMLVYWIALTMFLTAVFVLGMVFQLISWAGRAWRGEPLFDD